MSDCRFGVSPVNYPDPDPGRLGSNYHPEIKKLLNGTRQVCLFSISFYPYCYTHSFEDYEQVYCIVLYTPVLQDESCKTTVGLFNQHRG